MSLGRREKRSSFDMLLPPLLPLLPLLAKSAMRLDEKISVRVFTSLMRACLLKGVVFGVVSGVSDVDGIGVVSGVEGGAVVDAMTAR